MVFYHIVERALALFYNKTLLISYNSQKEKLKLSQLLYTHAINILSPHSLLSYRIGAWLFNIESIVFLQSLWSQIYIYISAYSMSSQLRAAFLLLQYWYLLSYTGTRYQATPSVTEMEKTFKFTITKSLNKANSTRVPFSFVSIGVRE